MMSAYKNFFLILKTGPHYSYESDKSGAYLKH